MRVGDFSGTKIYRAWPEGKQTKKDGTPRDPRKLGKIHFPVFTPDGRMLIGFMVRLPDRVGMFKQPDRFVARDAVGVVEGVLTVADGKANYDTAAAKRLGVNLDTCVIWTGMDVVTESGTKIGYCSDAECNAKTGRVLSFRVSMGGAASALLGDRDMPANLLRGYRNGCMIVRDEAADLELSGGAAAQAAVVSVKTSAAVKKGAAKLDETGSKAVTKGSRALGRQISRTKGMFSSFMSEYKAAAGSGSGSSGTGSKGGSKGSKNAKGAAVATRGSSAKTVHTGKARSTGHAKDRATGAAGSGAASSSAPASSHARTHKKSTGDE